ncbi:hypothetical protein MWU76_16860 [Gelidibacter sp. F2691]|nr:hypothetical protein [Gelidibacter sp. F2691]
MRYTWPGRGRAGVDFALRRHEFNAIKSIHAPEGLFDEIFGHRAEYLRVLENLGAFSDANRWIPLGPTGMLKGQATGSPIVAGRVRDLKVAPDGSRAYAGAGDGGVWVTRNAGQSWAPLGSWGVNPTAASGSGGRVQSLTIGALDVEFGATEDQDVVYAATGELTANASTSHSGKHAGVGILRLDGTLSNALGNIGSIPWLREGTAMRGAGIFRLTHEPGVPLSFDHTGENVMIAAASSGLYFRDGPFVPDAAWTRIERAPFDFDANSSAHVSDVLWTGSTPKRIYAALTHGSGRPAVYVTEGGPDSDYDKINLNGVRRDVRLSMAVAPSNPDVVYVLGTGAHNRARLWRIEGTGPARVVENVPPGLFGTPKEEGNRVKVDGNSSGYNNSVAVDPADESIVYVAGSTIEVDDVHNANMHKLTISGTHAANNYSTDFDTEKNLSAETDPTYFGDKAHADVHAIRPVGSEVWIGCDGGVFVDRGAGMVSLNYGLAISEPGFLACHPTTPGALIAGTQDNGRIERVGGSIWKLWRKGDGGGVAYHATNPAYYLGQYKEASWGQNDGWFTQPVFRTAYAAGVNPPQSETNENDASLFYSGIAAVAGVGDETRVAIGTTRLWFSPDWNPANADNTWVTLPSGVDARTPGSEHDRQDNYGRRDDFDELEKTVTLRWAQRGDDANSFDGARLLVLTTFNIYQFSYDAGEDTWTRHRFTEKKFKNRTNENNEITPGPSLKLPFIGMWTDVFPHDPSRGSHGSFYVSTTSKSKMTDTGAVGEADRMDTLWWFDGEETWHPTGLRNQGLDPVAGTSGTKAPQFAVVVHPDDANIVFVGGSAGVWRGVLSFSGGTPSWSWTGEINGLPQAVVQDLVIFQEGDLRLLRAALESRGVWELNISDTPTSVGNTYLRVTNLDTRQAEIDAAPIDPLSTTNPPARFSLDMSPDILVYGGLSAPTWSAGALPNEAEMFVWTEAYRRPGLVRYRRPPNIYPAYVMVHHRDTDPLAGNQVTVILLRLANAPVDLTTVPIDTPWRQAVMALVDGSSNAPPTGWELAEPGAPRRNLGGPVEARVPRAVHFSADLSHSVTNASGEDDELLVGIVSSTRDPLSLPQLNRNNLAMLIRRSRKVAARRFRRSR